MNRDPIEQIKHSWEANALAWTEAVRSGAIESRSVATNASIVQALTERQARRVLDLGCGEGWLARTLTQQGVEVVGVDASAPLIELAQAKGGGLFYHCSYEELISNPHRVGYDFEAIACNFSLLEEDLLKLFKALQGCLVQDGILVIQTVHPWSAGGQETYRDGWRTETFAGFGEKFTAAMPWYFRTLSSWFSLLRDSGYLLKDLREPVHPHTGKLLSLLLIASPAH